MISSWQCPWASMEHVVTRKFSSRDIFTMQMCLDFWLYRSILIGMEARPAVGAPRPTTASTRQQGWAGSRPGRGRRDVQVPCLWRGGHVRHQQLLQHCETSFFNHRRHIRSEKWTSGCGAYRRDEPACTECLTTAPRPNWQYEGI